MKHCYFCEKGGRVCEHARPKNQLCYFYKARGMESEPVRTTQLIRCPKAA